MGSTLVIKRLPWSEKRILMARVQAISDEHAHSMGHEYSGGWNMCHGLTFGPTTPFASEEAAAEYIENHTEKWGPLMAVSFRSVEKTASASPSKLATLKHKAQQLNEELWAFPAKVLARVKAGASSTKKCGTCGSTIAVAYLKSVPCPVCNAVFLYTATDLQKTDALKKKVADATKAVIAEEKRLSDKAQAGGSTKGLMWLVGGWCAE